MKKQVSNPVTIQHQFDSFVKKVLAGEVKSYRAEMARQSAKEALLPPSFQPLTCVRRRPVPRPHLQLLIIWRYAPPSANEEDRHARHRCSGLPAQPRRPPHGGGLPGGCSPGGRADNQWNPRLRRHHRPCRTPAGQCGPDRRRTRRGLSDVAHRRERRGPAAGRL